MRSILNYIIFPALACLLGTSSAFATTTPCEDGFAGDYPCSNIDLLSHLPLSVIGPGSEANDCWGWADALTGKEFALVGLTDGTSFVDISDPENPVFLGILPSHTGSSPWRDIKTYADHAFVVSDGNGAHGLQIFDLTQLRQVSQPPVTFSETAHYDGFASAHNLVINEETGFAYVVGSDQASGGLFILNIQDPADPVLAGIFSQDGYTSDAQCVNYVGPDTDHQGQEICLACNEDTITIVDVTNKLSSVQLSRTGYPELGYVNQGWLSADQRYFLHGDTLDEISVPSNTRTHIWDMIDLDQPQYLGFHEASTAAIDHNQYVVGLTLFQANFSAGLRLLDLSNIAQGSLNETGFFDIYPADDAAQFNGAWSTYPFLPSGKIIVSGIEQGLFVLRVNSPTSTPSESPELFAFHAPKPNPFNPHTTISFTLERAEGVRVGIYELSGRRVTELAARDFGAGSHSLTWNGRDNRGQAVPSGPYLVRLETPSNVEVRKVMLVQ